MKKKTPGLNVSDETLRVYDGNAALRQNSYRLISVPQSSSVQQIKVGGKLTENKTELTELFLVW